MKHRVRKAREPLAAGAAVDDPLARGAALRLADLLPPIRNVTGRHAPTGR